MFITVVIVVVVIVVVVVVVIDGLHHATQRVKGLELGRAWA